MKSEYDLIVPAVSQQIFQNNNNNNSVTLSAGDITLDDTGEPIYP